MRITNAYNFDEIVLDFRNMRGRHYHWLDEAVNNPTCVGLHGGYRDARPFADKFILEWKVQRSVDNRLLLNRLEAGLLGENSPFTEAIQRATDQPIVWLTHGKGHSDNGILVARYSARTNRDELEAAWLRRVYPLFYDGIWRYLAR